MGRGVSDKPGHKRRESRLGWGSEAQLPEGKQAKEAEFHQREKNRVLGRR